MSFSKKFGLSAPLDASDILKKTIGQQTVEHYKIVKHAPTLDLFWNVAYYSYGYPHYKEGL